MKVLKNSITSVFLFASFSCVSFYDLIKREEWDFLLSVDFLLRCGTCSQSHTTLRALITASKSSRNASPRTPSTRLMEFKVLPIPETRGS